MLRLDARRADELGGRTRHGVSGGRGRLDRCVALLEVVVILESPVGERAEDEQEHRQVQHPALPIRIAALAAPLQPLTRRDIVIQVPTSIVLVRSHGFLFLSES